jgi:fructose-bisphosphate aldolase/2-amino-3,7-dideoxy-D-threo-hept-6-ulosonate synthase
MASGRKLRLDKLRHKSSHKSFFLPLDHGATVGPIDGINRMRQTLERVSSSAASIQGVVVHRGVAINGNGPHWDVPAPLILHLSASTILARDSTHKVLVAQVEDALTMGADAVSIHVNLGALAEAGMLRDFGNVANHCERWGMPLLAMMYTHGDMGATTAIQRIKHSARVAAELGADFVKVNYPGSAEAMAEVVDGCFVPVLVAGGERTSSEGHLLELVADAMAGGAGGICIGRNVFQSQDPSALLGKLSGLVHAGTLRVVSSNESPVALAAVN